MSTHGALAAELAAQIRKDILVERLKPGDKITELALCKYYNVSRTPIREALKQIEAEGLIGSAPNCSPVIVGISDSDLRDIFALRILYEIQAIKWGALRRSEAELEKIGESFEFMQFYTKRMDANRLRTINTGFHRRIAESAHNRFLLTELIRMQDYIRYSARIRQYQEEDLSDILEEHRLIYKAYSSGDPEECARSMERHLHSSLLRTNL